MRIFVRILPKVLFVLLLTLAVAAPAGYGLVSQYSRFVVAAVLGGLMFLAVMRSDVRIPVILIYVCLLCADSNVHLLARYGKMLRWCVFGALAFKEITHWTFSRSIRFRMTPVHAVFLLLIAVAMISSTYSVDWLLTFKRSFSVLLFYIVVFIYFWRQMEHPENRIDMAEFLVRLVPIIYLIEVVYTVAVGDAAWYGGRLRGMRGNPNGLGLLIMMTMPLLVWALLVKRKGNLRAYALFGTAMGLVLLIMCSSRASIFGLALCLFIMSIRLMPRHVLFFVVGGAFLVMLVEARGYASGESRLARRVIEAVSRHGGGYPLAGREEAWARSLQLGMERYAGGHGFGTAEETFGRMEFDVHYGGYPHNFVMHIFVDLGIPGVILALLIQIILVYYSVALMSVGPRLRSIEYGLPVVVVGMYAAGIFNAIFENWMFSAGSPGGFPFWLMAAMVTRYHCLLQSGTTMSFMEYRRYQRSGRRPLSIPVGEVRRRDPAVK